MAYEPYHHKYRPQTFSELVGQKAIATTLTNALTQEKIAPAYLFSGPRGTGKTSSARIFAKSLNCQRAAKPTPNPCGECEVCRAIASGQALDVIEIDAASNTGVDNIREIIERAQFAPVQCRYKVYVIDECHMLSTAAFNALLKTLEEPPERVIFVLATTDPQRVLPTIISRCQRFDYRRIPLTAMAEHLTHIAVQEGLAIAPAAINLVAQLANGGLRDAESLLDQLSLLSGEITPEQVWGLVGAVPEQELLTLIKVIAADDPTAVLAQCRASLDRGREPLTVLQNLTSFYLSLLIAKTAPDQREMAGITETTWLQLGREAQQWTLPNILFGQQQLKAAEIQIKQTTQPRLWLEVTLLGLLPSAQQTLAPTGVAPARAPRAGSTTPPPPRTVAPVQASTPTASTNGHKAAPLSSTPASNGHRTPSSSVSTPPEPEVQKVKPLAAETPAPTRSAPPESFSAQTPSTQSHNNGAAGVKPSTTTVSNIADLGQLWEDCLELIELPTTKALLKQHGSLLSLGSGVAQVGIRSKAILSMVQRHVPVLEGCLNKATGQSVKVSLEVSSNLTPLPQAEKSAPVPAPPPAAIAKSSPTETAAQQTTSHPPEKTAQNRAVAAAPSAAKAAAQIAELFQGEVIDCPSDEETEAVAESVLSQTRSAIPDLPVPDSEIIPAVASTNVLSGATVQEPPPLQETSPDPSDKIPAFSSAPQSAAAERRNPQESTLSTAASVGAPRIANRPTVADPDEDIPF
ncbi:MAG: DNA polymerase III subunit gamma/tau [Cyanobacteria bacterium P01_H01_bin.15]